MNFFQKNCYLHKDQILKLFCESCEEPICHECHMIGPHNNKLHKIVNIVDSYRRKLSYINTLKNKNMTNKYNDLMNQIQYLDNISKQIKEKKEGKKSMDDVVKNFYEWDSKRKEKLNDKIKTKEKNIKKDLKKKPQINKNSYLITVNRNPDQIFNRLYIDDINKRKERQQMLEHIYTPSFQPNLVKIKNEKKK